MSIFNITVDTIDTQGTVYNKIAPSQDMVQSSASPYAPGAWDVARNIGSYFHAIANGSTSAKINYQDGLTFATGYMTFTDNPSNTDTFTIAGVSTELVTGTPSGAQVKIGSSLAATMANIVTYLNAGGNALALAGICWGVVYSSTQIKFWAAYPGPIGNLITCSKSCTNMSSITNPLAGGAVAAGSNPALWAGCGR